MENFNTTCQNSLPYVKASAAWNAMLHPFVNMTIKLFAVTDLDARWLIRLDTYRTATGGLGSVLGSVTSYTSFHWCKIVLFNVPRHKSISPANR